MELPNGRSFALTAPSDDGDDERSSRRRAKHAPELIAAKNALLEEFVACCMATKGLTPKKIHKRDHAAAFALAQTYGVAEACAILRRAFDDPFVRTKNTTLAFIESKAETYRGSAVKKTAGRRELQALTGDEPWLKEHQR
jgi:23S rRNA maturation mini-RNase III